MKRATQIPGTLLRVIGMALIFCTLPLLNAQEITKKRGKVTCRYADGHKAASGRADNYTKNGTWKYWDEQGALHHIATFVHDTLQGQYIEYDTDLSVTVFGNYNHGLKNGVWRFYYADGKPSAENTYADGRLDGRQIAWYENGNVREIMLCSDDKILSRKAWYSGGQLKLVESYKDGVSDGRWVVYPDPELTQDTFPSEVNEYVNGKRDGWHYAFMNGSKMEEVHYVSGEADGNCTRWDEHGHLQSEEHFTSGKRDGNCRYYNCNGLLRDITYVGGEQTGPQTDYDRNGDTLNVTWFSDGIRDSMKTFHPNGVTATRRAYARASDQTEHSEYTEWDDQGVKLVYGRYKDGMKYGEWYTYYPDGTKKSLTTYKNGVMDGLYTKYYPNGKRMVEFTMLPDGSHTPALVWTETGKPMRSGTQKYTDIVQSATPGETYIDPVVSRPLIDKQMAEATPSHLQSDAGNETAAPSAIEAEDNTIYSVVDVAPTFPGGAAAMQDFIDDNLVHPASLFYMQGTVYISYVVEKDGSISDIQPVQEVKGGPEFTKEAMRVVQSFPEMEPAMKDGKPVRCRVILPVQFNLH